MFKFLRHNKILTGSALLSGSLVFCYYFYSKSNHKLQLESKGHHNKPKYFTLDEVKKHNKKDDCWVIHKDRVFDVTNFIPIHPGGEKILMGAGKKIDSYWNVYTIHQKEEVYEIIEKYYIGELSLEDRKNVLEIVKDEFSSDPERSELLNALSKKPFNAETPLEFLSDYITPNEIFYKRNHLPVPTVSNSILKIRDDNKEVLVDLDKINDLKEKQILSVLQCAGNRRKDVKEGTNKEVQGLSWDAGAIGNSVWGGFLLKDLFEKFGFSTEGYNHIEFKGSDGYSASIPVSAMAHPVLIAQSMNNEQLLPDHGFPRRIVVPGHVAARSVKWVNEIVLSKEESYSHWQRKDYKAVSPAITNITDKDWENSRSIQEMPVQSAIVYPLRNSKINDRSVTVKGYAWSGGGRDVIRVDLQTSNSKGKEWHECSITKTPYDFYDEQEDITKTKCYGWVQWECDVPLEKGVTELAVKAVDESYNTQPEGVDGIWNKRGLLCNAWHKVKVEVV